MKHFPSAVHWETREAALPRRRRLGYLARHGSTRTWHGTERDIQALGAKILVPRSWFQDLGIKNLGTKFMGRSVGHIHNDVSCRARI